MQSEEPEPEPELEQLTERVEHLEERMSQFEQQLRSLPDPPAAAQDRDAWAATPDPGTETTQEQDGHANASEA
jgi:predicted nuclease with TOPRIM domain